MLSALFRREVYNLLQSFFWIFLKKSSCSPFSIYFCLRICCPFLYTDFLSIAAYSSFSFRTQSKIQSLHFLPPIQFATITSFCSMIPLTVLSLIFYPSCQHRVCPLMSSCSLPYTALTSSQTSCLLPLNQSTSNLLLQSNTILTEMAYKFIALTVSFALSYIFLSFTSVSTYSFLHFIINLWRIHECLQFLMLLMCSIMLLSISILCNICAV